MKRLILEQSSEEFYTSHSGLALAGACINRYSDLGRYVGRVAKGSDHIAEIDILRSYLGLLCLGKSDYQAIVAMREDDYFKQALGVDRIPSVERLRQRLDEARLRMHLLVFLEPLIQRSRECPFGPTGIEGIIEVLPEFREGLKDLEGFSHVYDVILLFKILILQSLYNLSDDATEFQILDRHSFARFLGLHICQKVPDATTIWRFREDLTKAVIVEELFATFDAHLRTNGFMAMKGQIVDASIVNVPKQRNSREENAKIQEGEIPENWPENKRRRKDVDACWTKKNGKASQAKSLGPTKPTGEMYSQDGGAQIT